MPLFNPSTGFANPMTTEGDIIVGGVAGAPTRLPLGTTGEILTASPTTAIWNPNAGPNFGPPLPPGLPNSMWVVTIAGGNFLATLIDHTGATVTSFTVAEQGDILSQSLPWFAMSPSGNYFALAGLHIVKVVNATTGALIQTFNLPVGNDLSSVTFDRFDNLYVMSQHQGVSGTIQGYAPPFTGAAFATYNDGTATYIWDMTAVNGYLLVSGGAVAPTHVLVLFAASLTSAGVIVMPANLASLVPSDGSAIVAAMENGTLYTLNPTLLTATELGAFAFPDAGVQAFAVLSNEVLCNTGPATYDGVAVPGAAVTTFSLAQAGYTVCYPSSVVNAAGATFVYGLLQGGTIYIAGANAAGTALAPVATAIASTAPNFQGLIASNYSRNISNVI